MNNKISTVKNKNKEKKTVLRSFRFTNSNIIKLRKIAVKKKCNLSVVLRDLINTI